MTCTCTGGVTVGRQLTKNELPSVGDCWMSLRVNSMRSRSCAACLRWLAEDLCTLHGIDAEVLYEPNQTLILQIANVQVVFLHFRNEQVPGSQACCARGQADHSRIVSTSPRDMGQPAVIHILETEESRCFTATSRLPPDRRF